MKVLFASGDVGGARALLPVIDVCAQNNLSLAVLDHGHITKEAQPDWRRVSLGGVVDGGTLERLLTEHNVRVLVFTSSVKDTIALTLARRAQAVGIPTIHVLDSWTGYRRRLETDGFPTFVPDVYAVMDTLAFEGAVRAGIDQATLVVTGQPALASLSEEYASWANRDRRQERERFGLDQDKTMILFISEPVEHDQGASPESPMFRGYTEKIVLRLFCEALQPFSDRVEIGILPHPREDADGLLRLWSERRGSLDGGVIRVDKGRESLFLADGVAGMASILLYEAWLLDKPVISLQPGLGLEPLRMLGKRNGVVFVDSYENVTASTTAWVSAIRPGSETNPCPELRLHEKAPGNVFRLIEKCLRQTDLRRAVNGERTTS